MVELSVGLNQYNIPTTWSEISVSKAVKLYDIANTIPRCLRDKYDLVFKSKAESEEVEAWAETLTEEDLLEKMPEFYKKVVYFLSSIDVDIDDESASNVYYAFCEYFICGILYNGVGYDPVKISSFKFKGNEYLLPKDKKIGDVVIPMYDLKLIQFAEASDMLMMIGDQGYKFASFIVAVLCLTKGEIYNEEVILKRAKEFEELDMATVWDVFFYLMSSVATLRRGLERYSHQEVLKLRKHRVDLDKVGEDLHWIFTPSQATCFSLN